MSGRSEFLLTIPCLFAPLCDVVQNLPGLKGATAWDYATLMARRNLEGCRSECATSLKMAASSWRAMFVYVENHLNL